jgi:Flp pilus assembly protein CpaB
VENLAPSRLLKTRQGTIALGIGAAVLAAILLLVYLSHYRSSVKGSSEAVTVLVAKRLIPKGTSGAALASKDLFDATTIPKGQLKVGAISDSALLRGTVAATDIYPAQQLTASDFTTPSAGALASQLSGRWRAISISLDAVHGLSPDVVAGDHVDVYAQLDGVKSPVGVEKTLGLLMPDVTVIATPTQAAAGTTAPASGNYVLRIPSRQTARFLYMAQNGNIWFALRPAIGAKKTPRAFVTSNNIYAGSLGQGQFIVGGH